MKIIRRQEIASSSWKSVFSSMLPDLKKSVLPGWQLAIRDLKSNYSVNILGYAWIVLPPLVTTVVWLSLSQAGIANLNNKTGMPYPVFVTLGTVLWSLFVDAVNCLKNQLSGNMETIATTSLPAEALMVSGGIQLALNFLIRLLMIVPVCIWTGYSPSFWSAFIIFPSIVLGCMGLALGVFLSPFASIYKDINQGISLILPLIMFTAPVVYDVPKKGILEKIMILNPLTYPIEAVRGMVAGTINCQGILINTVIFIITLLFIITFWAAFKITLLYLIERK